MYEESSYLILCLKRKRNTSEMAYIIPKMKYKVLNPIQEQV